jgi:predicted permease
MQPHIWIVRLLSRIVPRRFRLDWKQEWEAELHHRESVQTRWHRLSWEDRWKLFLQSAGAFWDALAMQPRRLEEEIFQDLRYGARMLLKTKGLTAVAVLSLALGIGANTALFSMMDAMMLRLLPVKDPEQLVLFNWSTQMQAIPWALDGDSMMQRDPKTGFRTATSFLSSTFAAFRMRHETLADVFGFARLSQLNIVAEGNAEIAKGQLVSGNYFSVLGVNAARGRIIVDEDDRETAPPVAVISHRYWERRFELDRSIIGKQIVVNNIDMTVVGVAPSGFSGTLQVNDRPDIYIPLTLEPRIRPQTAYLHSQAWWIQIMGRMKLGATADQVRGNLSGIFEQTALDAWKASGAPGPIDIPRFSIVSGSQGLNDYRVSFSRPLWILTALMGLVLLIASANVANLLLARATARQKEFATRFAMGAGRLRILRQLLTESVLLAAAGGGLGAIFAYWGKDLLILWGPWSDTAGDGSAFIDARLDLRVLAFTAAISLLTGVLFGLAPALRGLKVDLAPAMGGGSRSFSPVRSRLGRSLLVVQVAMSVTLLIAAALFVQTLWNLQRVDRGFNPDRLLLLRFDPRLNNYTIDQVANVVDRVLERVLSLPGVRAASASNRTLASGGGNFGSRPNRDGSRSEIRAAFMPVGPNFFETMELPILRGRGLTRFDGPNAPRVTVIKETLARRYFDGTDPIGREVMGMDVVGVVRDAKIRNLREETWPTVYVSYLQDPPRQMTFEVRTVGDPSALVPSIRQIVHDVDPNLPLYEIKTQQEQIEQTMMQERLFATFASAFGAIAMLLVSVGLYGLMSYSVARRTQELGIRMALGAKRTRIFGLVMGETLFLVFAGVGLGLAAALTLARTISSMLFGLEPNDPLTVSVAVGLIVAVALMAGYLPARRAARVDPMVALRYE